MTTHAATPHAPHAYHRRIWGRITICTTLVAALAATAPVAASAAPSPTVTVNNVTVIETDAGSVAATFTIKASPRPRSCCRLSVDWSTADATAVSPVDYVSGSGTVTLTRRSPTARVTVMVKGDVLDEADESFTLNLTGLIGAPGAIGDPQGVGTISDDDAMPSASIRDGFVIEGDAGTAEITFPIVLSAPSGRPVQVDWATSDGTATQPDDYATVSGTVVFVPGEISKTVSVDVVGDEVVEPNETFNVSLSSPVNAILGVVTSTGTILDDDDATPGKLSTALTLRVVKRMRVVRAKGLLEPASSGQYVRVALLRKRNGAFIRIASKVVAVRDIRDRDSDAAPDGAYAIAFQRPRRSGTYKIAARFVATTTHASSTRSIVFKL